MYTEISVQFRCPKCGNDKVAQVLKDVTVKQFVESISSNSGDRSTAKKFDLLTGWTGSSAGKVSHFECSACGHILMSKPKLGGSPRPIKSAFQLLGWLKRNNWGG